MRKFKSREANQGVDGSLVEKFHCRKKSVCPSELIYLVLFGIRRDEGKDVFGQGAFGSGPKYTV